MTVAAVVAAAVATGPARPGTRWRARGRPPIGDGPWSSGFAGRCTTTCSSRRYDSPSAWAGSSPPSIAGAETTPALFAFALGAFGFGVSLVTADRVFAGGTKALPAPPHVLESRLSTLAAAVWPSTIGVAALMIISLGVNATLAALLAGVQVGMGVAGLLSALRIAAREQEVGGRLLDRPCG